jgi:predicted transglutaminase-like cysteine proteinase
MRAGTSIALVTAATAIFAAHGVATAATSDGLSPFMATSGTSSQPYGHFEFCQTHPDECSIASASVDRVRITTARWKELIAINAKVNRSIAPATDMDIYGREEWWTYPGPEGDCEDVALLKRHYLIAKGWPVGALLMTVVRRPNGEGHAVLTVLTDRGDLVLDNLDGRIRLWTETPYAYVKRQSEFNSGQWTAIQDTRTPKVGSTR